MLKNEWKNVEVGSILKKDTQKIKDSVLAKNYLKEGEFKIVSQSKDLVSGYSNDESLLNDLTKPVIIFGDHTQVIKYVDFPFVLGADGVKVFEPYDEYGTKFFYYLLKSINLNSNKYARHFSLLRKEKIPFKKDSLELQNSIISYLSDFEKNDLSEKTYFDFETEEKIKKLHTSNISVSTLLYGFLNQKTYLTKLRQAILQEAIEGKLTADWRVNNPVCLGNPEYDAAALLKTIKTEKQKLITEGKIKKEKPLAPINPDDVPFTLPDGWVWVRLGEVLELISDYHANGSYEILKENVELLDSEDFAIMLRTTNFGAKNLNTYKYISEKAYHFLSKSKLFSGDIIMNKIGDPGATYFVENRGKPMSLAMNLFLLRFSSGNMNNKFSFLYLNSQYYYIKSFANGTATQTITKDAVNKLLFPLPPLAEQNAIVERVDRLLATVNALEQQVQARKTYAEQLMQAVLKEAFAA